MHARGPAFGPHRGLVADRKPALRGWGQRSAEGGTRLCQTWRPARPRPRVAALLAVATWGVPVSARLRGPCGRRARGAGGVSAQGPVSGPRSTLLPGGRSNTVRVTRSHVVTVAGPRPRRRARDSWCVCPRDVRRSPEGPWRLSYVRGRWACDRHRLRSCDPSQVYGRWTGSFLGYTDERPPHPLPLGT